MNECCPAVIEDWQFFFIKIQYGVALDHKQSTCSRKPPVYSKSGCIRHGAVVFCIVNWKWTNGESREMSYKYIDRCMAYTDPLWSTLYVRKLCRIYFLFIEGTMEAGVNANRNLKFWILTRENKNESVTTWIEVGPIFGRNLACGFLGPLVVNLWKEFAPFGLILSVHGMAQCCFEY